MRILVLALALLVTTAHAAPKAQVVEAALKQFFGNGIPLTGPNGERVNVKLLRVQTLKNGEYAAIFKYQ